MRKLVVILVFIVSLLGCYTPSFEVTFEEAIEQITDQYGDPWEIRDLKVDDGGAVLRRSVYWTIDPPEPYYVKVYYGPGNDNYHLDERFYTTVYADVRNDPNSITEESGWFLYNWSKNNFIYDID